MSSPPVSPPTTSGSRPRSSRRPQTGTRPMTAQARPDTAESVSNLGPLPPQQFFPEGDDLEEGEEDFYEEPDQDVFAFERPLTGAVPPAGFSDSGYTSSAPGTGTQTMESGMYGTLTSRTMSSSAGRSPHLSHHHSQDIGTPDVTSTGNIDGTGQLPELQYDKEHPPMFSGRENLNNSSFAFMNKLNRETKQKLSRPPTGQSLLSRLQQRNMHTATTQTSAMTESSGLSRSSGVTGVTGVTGATGMTTNSDMSGLTHSHPVMQQAKDDSDTRSFDTFLSNGTTDDKQMSGSSLPLIPSTAAGTNSEFGSNTSATGTRRLMSRGSYGMTELTGDATVPDGMTTWGDGMGGVGVIKEGSEGGSMAGVDVDMMEEDSPYPEVRASVSNIDDPDMPALTFRTWLLGLFFCIIATAANTFFHFRTPSPYISPFIIQVVSYPCGKFLAWCMPIRTWQVPRWLGGEFSFNPGPFNIKEHTLIVIMANAATNSSYALYATVAGQLWYGYNFNTGFNILFVFAVQLTGFSLSGLARRFVIWPASMIWPTTLVVCTNLNTFHAEDESFQGGMSRFRFLMITVGAAFCYYFFPGFIFTALSYFSFMCWIFPTRRVVNQLFGVSTGLGMSVLTFDWSQISWIGPPLATPWWAEVNIAIGFVLFYWIIVPIMYYTNVWNFSYLPMSVSAAVDRFGAPYNIFNILTPEYTLNTTAYHEYSPIYLSATYSMTFMLSFALSTGIIVHTLLYHRARIYRAIVNVRTEADDIHLKLMRQYPEVPDWWYLLLLAFCVICSIVSLEVYHAGLPIWGYGLSILLPLLYLIPSAIIFAMTGQLIALNLLSELIPGYLFQGRPIPTMIFKCFSLGTIEESMNFIQNLKLGHYMKLPPRSTFIAQITSTLICSLVQVGTKDLLFATVSDVCGNKPKDLLSCASTKVFFTSSVIWGLIGPQRLFSPGSFYHPQIYAAIVGAFLPIPIWLWVRKHPKSMLRNVNLPVLFNGGLNIPPATGINFASFLVTGFVFQFWMRRRHFAWWSKYNYVLSAGMDVGTAVSALFIFLVLDFPGASINWWGNTVYTNTDDWNGTSYLTAPPEGFGPSSW